MSEEIKEMNEVIEIAKKVMAKGTTLKFVSLTVDKLAFVLEGVKNGVAYKIQRGCLDYTSGAYEAVNLNIRLEKGYEFFKNCSAERAAETKARLEISQEVPIEELVIALGEDSVNKLKRELGREIESCSFFELPIINGCSKHYYVASIANIDYIFEQNTM